jgi:hypothetical protein
MTSARLTVRCAPLVPAVATSAANAAVIIPGLILCMVVTGKIIRTAAPR